MDLLTIQVNVSSQGELCSLKLFANHVMNYQKRHNENKLPLAGNTQNFIWLLNM